MLIQCMSTNIGRDVAKHNNYKNRVFENTDGCHLLLFNKGTSETLFFSFALNLLTAGTLIISSLC